MSAKAKTTYAEKMGAAIDKVAQQLQKKREALGRKQVSDTVMWDELLDKENRVDLDRFAIWLRESGQMAGKVSGGVALWTLEYTVRALNALMVDNPVLRGIEKKLRTAKKTKAGKSLPSKVYAGALNKIKENPAKSSYAAYYALLATLLFSAKGIALSGKETSDDKKQPAQGHVIDNDNATNLVVPAQDVQPLEDAIAQQTLMLQVINSDDADFVNKAINEYWPTIAVGLTEFETYRDTPKKHSGETRYTNGLGCTWQYWYDNSGKLYKKENLQGNTDALSRDKNYEQAKRHLIYETMPSLKTAIKGKNNITAQQCVALCFVGYQRPADMDNIASAISKAKNAQEIADAFQYYTGSNKWRDGTLKRRWWCAAYALGLISIQDLMTLPRDAFSRINLNNVYRNGHFLLGKETVKYALNTARNGTQTSVDAFLNSFQTGRTLLATARQQSSGAVYAGVQIEQTEQSQQIEGAMALLNQANELVAKRNYDGAVKLYKQAIQQDIDNMEAYSSLALTYKKLGDKNKSVEFYELCVQTVKDGNARMNANKSLLLDREIKASSYFNAGSAREEMAKLYAAQGKIDVAIKNYDWARKNYKTALDNANMDGIDDGRKDVYQKAIDRVDSEVAKLNKKKSRKIAYNTGAQQLQPKKKSGDTLIYGVQREIA